MIAQLRDTFWRFWMPLAARAARGYVAGPELDDALRAARDLDARGFRSTVCYWNRQEDTPRQVTDSYLTALERFSKERTDWYLSVKAPALEFASPLVEEIVACCLKHGVRAHFDAHGPETAEKTFGLIREQLARTKGADHCASLLGCTLPGRWRRSVTDAGWAAERGLSVRVVKGQWKDTEDPSRDPGKGFIEVIRQLAGGAKHVAVASHDVQVVKTSLKLLRDAGTSCELELLYGLPLQHAVSEARNAGVPVRIYIPYGYGWLPYCLSQVRKNPRILWWLAQDLLGLRSLNPAPAARTPS